MAECAYRPEKFQMEVTTTSKNTCYQTARAIKNWSISTIPVERTVLISIAFATRSADFISLLQLWVVWISKAVKWLDLGEIPGQLLNTDKNLVYMRTTSYCTDPAFPKRVFSYAHSLSFHSYSIPPNE